MHSAQPSLSTSITTPHSSSSRTTPSSSSFCCATLRTRRARQPLETWRSGAGPLLMRWSLAQLLTAALFAPWLVSAWHTLVRYGGNGDSPAFGAMLWRSLGVFALSETVPHPIWRFAGGLLAGAIIVAGLAFGLRNRDSAENSSGTVAGQDPESQADESPPKSAEDQLQPLPDQSDATVFLLLYLFVPLLAGLARRTPASHIRRTLSGRRAAPFPASDSRQRRQDEQLGRYAPELALALLGRRRSRRKQPARFVNPSLQPSRQNPARPHLRCRTHNPRPGRQRLQPAQSLFRKQIIGMARAGRDAGSLDLRPAGTGRAYRHELPRTDPPLLLQRRCPTIPDSPQPP